MAIDIVEYEKSLTEILAGGPGSGRHKELAKVDIGQDINDIRIATRDNTGGISRYGHHWELRHSIGGIAKHADSRSFWYKNGERVSMKQFHDDLREAKLAFGKKPSIKGAGTQGKWKLEDEYDFQGMPICIENKKGSVRSGQEPSGKKWSIKMPFDYGYIKGTSGTDGDEVDCFIGPDKNAKYVYIVHQRTNDAKKKYDEDKCMLGFSSADEAKEAYHSAYNNVDLFTSMSMMSVDEFKDKLKKFSGKKIHAALAAGGPGSGRHAEFPAEVQQFHRDEVNAWLGKAPLLKVVSEKMEMLDPSKLIRTQDWVNEKKLSQWKDVPAGHMPAVTVLRTKLGDYLFDGTHRTEHAQRRGEKVPANVLTVTMHDDVHAGGPGSGRKKTVDDEVKAILKKKWKNQTDEERHKVASKDPRQMKLFGGGPGSGRHKSGQNNDWLTRKSPTGFGHNDRIKGLSFNEKKLKPLLDELTRKKYVYQKTVKDSGGGNSHLYKTAKGKRATLLEPSGQQLARGKFNRIVYHDVEAGGPGSGRHKETTGKPEVRNILNKRSLAIQHANLVKDGYTYSHTKLVNKQKKHYRHYYKDSSGKVVWYISDSLGLGSHTIRAGGKFNRIVYHDVKAGGPGSGRKPGLKELVWECQHCGTGMYGKDIKRSSFYSENCKECGEPKGTGPEDTDRENEKRYGMKGGGKGSGWTTENGHVKHVNYVEKEKKLALRRQQSIDKNRALQQQGLSVRGKPIVSEKAKRALANMNVATKPVHDLAEKVEQTICKVLGAKKSGDNAPFDAVLQIGRKTYGIEIKTLATQRNDKITQKDAAIQRKMSFAQKNGIRADRIFTVAADYRAPDGKGGFAPTKKIPDLYIRAGVGSFRLGSMIQVGRGFKGLKEYF